MGGLRLRFLEGGCGAGHGSGQLKNALRTETHAQVSLTEAIRAKHSKCPDGNRTGAHSHHSPRVNKHRQNT